jgi:hypothetical protein
MTAISRGLQGFFHIKSSEPGFSATATTAAGLYAIEASAVTRQWLPPGASGKAVRLASQSAADYYVVFGTSDVVAASTAAMLVLGGTVETFMAPAHVSHLSILGATTDITVNVSVGYGQ